MTDVIAILFLAMIAVALLFGAWIVIRQERAARHQCPHSPTIGNVHIRQVGSDADSSAQIRVAEFGTKSRGPVYDIDLNLQAGELR